MDSSMVRVGTRIRRMEMSMMVIGKRVFRMDTGCRSLEIQGTSTRVSGQMELSTARVNIAGMMVLRMKDFSLKENSMEGANSWLGTSKASTSVSGKTIPWKVKESISAAMTTPVTLRSTKEIGRVANKVDTGKLHGKHHEPSLQGTSQMDSPTARENSFCKMVSSVMESITRAKERSKFQQNLPPTLITEQA